MTEYSLPWGGTSTGDAGPFGADEWSEAWRIMFSNDPTVQGIVQWHAGKLAVTGDTSPMAVASGAALVHGTLYVNNASVNVAIASPVSSSRTDYVVLRKDHVNQTIRITLLAGTEGGAPPTLTQNATTYWDLKIAEATIAPGGSITIVEDLQYLHLGVPVDGVIHTTLTSAPAGFTEYTSGRGRYIVGLVSGGTMEGTVGDALTDKELLEHTHDYTQTPYHRHAVRTNTDPSPPTEGFMVPGDPSNGWTGSYTQYTGSATCTTLANTVTTAPYIQLLGIIKD